MGTQGSDFIPNILSQLSLSSRHELVGLTFQGLTTGVNTTSQIFEILSVDGDEIFVSPFNHELSSVVQDFPVMAIAYGVYFTTPWPGPYNVEFTAPSII